MDKRVPSFAPRTINTTVGLFPRPYPYQLEPIHGWANFDRAFRLIWESLADPNGLSYYPGCPLSNLECSLLFEAHTRRGPWLSWPALRAAFPQRMECDV